MATSQHTSFAPNEFVNRWLLDLQPPPGDRQDIAISHNTSKVPSKPEWHVKCCIEALEEEEQPASHRVSVSGDKDRTYVDQGGQTQARCMAFADATSVRRNHHHHQNHDKPEHSERHRRRRHYVDPSGHRLQPTLNVQRLKRKRPRSEASSRDVPVEAQPQNAPAQVAERSESGSNCSGSSSEASEGALQAEKHLATATVPLDTGKTYERRARHKTRPDRYVLKTDKKTSHKPAQEKGDKKPKRRRRKKNGLSLNHDFKAPNVPQDRLTLKPNTGPGIFHKGKASEPVERRGLPDLTFSEMTFLTKRRQPDTGPQKQLKAPSKKKSNRGTAQEISGFFSGPEKKKTDPREQKSDVVLRHPKSLVSSAISRTNSSPAKLGPREPLSVMSGNESARRARSNLSIGAGHHQQAWAQDYDVPGLKQLKHLREISQLDRSPANASTCYCSWSASPSRRGPDALTPRQTAERPLSPAVTREIIRREPRLAQDLGHQESAEMRDLSSLSDKSLDQYTKHVLLGKGDETAWQRMPPPAVWPGHYTLSDLKRLSQLAELDAAGVSVGEDPSQPQSGWQRVQGPHQTMTSRNEHQKPQNTYTEPLEPFVRPPALHRDGYVHSDASFAVRQDQERPRARPLRQEVTKDRSGSSQLFREGLPLHNLHLSAGRISWLLGTDSPVPNNGRRRHVAPGNGKRNKPSNDPGVPLWQYRADYEADPYYNNIAFDSPAHAARDPLMVEALSTQPRPADPDPAVEMYDFETQPNHLNQINAPWREKQQPVDTHYEFDRSLMREGAQQSQYDPSAHLLDHATMHASYDNALLPAAENAMYIDNTSFEPHQDSECLGPEPLYGENRAQSIQEEQHKSGHWLREGQSHVGMFGHGSGTLGSGEVFTGFARPHILY